MFLPVLPKLRWGMKYHLLHWGSECLSDLPNGHREEVEKQRLESEPAWPKMYAFSHFPPALLPWLHLFRMLQLQHITYMILLELLNTPLGQHSHANVPILPTKKLRVKEKSCLAHDYPAGQWQRWDQNPDLWNQDVWIGINVSKSMYQCW